MADKNYGRSDLMVTAAVRYCLGRSSCIVSDCADWLVEQWANFGENTRNIVLRDISEALDNDRAGGAMDAVTWARCWDALSALNLKLKGAK